MNKKLGSYLKQTRNERKLTLRAVEKRTGISNAYLSQLENSRIVEPSPSILQKLSYCYGVRYERLMQLAGYPLPSDKSNLENEAQAPAFRLGRNIDDLTEDEKKKVSEYIEFLRLRRRQ